MQSSESSREAQLKISDFAFDSLLHKDYLRDIKISFEPFNLMRMRL